MGIFCYQHHINDWRRDTSHLSLEERGVYRELLDAFYLTEGKLPNDAKQLARMIGAHSRRERAALDKITGMFFTVDGQFLDQKRARFEIQIVNQKSIKAKRSAEARWKDNNDLADANALPTHSERNANQQPITNNQESDSNLFPHDSPAAAKPAPKPKAAKPVPGEPDQFENFWMNFPRQRRGGREAALKAYRSALTRTTEEKINEAVIRYAQCDEVARGFAKGCAAWLNDDRYENDFRAAQQAPSGKRAYADSLKTAARGAVDSLREVERIRNEDRSARGDDSGTDRK